MVRRKDFNRTQLRNPYFSKPEKKSVRVSGRTVTITSLVIGVGLFGYLLMSGAMTITTVEVSGTDLINTADVQIAATQQLSQRRFFILPQQVIYFFSKRQLAHTLRETYALDHLTIDKDYPHTIRITVAERQPAFIWITGQDKYYVDQQGVNLLHIADQGVSYKTGTSTELIRPNAAVLEYPLVYDELNEPAATVGGTMVSDVLAGPIVEILGTLPEVVPVPVSRYVVNKSTREITAVTQAGWQIRFSADRPIKDQVTLVEVALGDTIKDTSKLQYIDVRFGDKIFYR